MSSASPALQEKKDVVVFIHYGILTAMSGRVKCDSMVLAGSTEYALSSHSLTGRYGRWGRLKAGFSGPICLARVARLIGRGLIGSQRYLLYHTL